MRLLHTTRLTLEDFFGRDPPPYAILSHRWELGEVTFEQFGQGDATRALPGWPKIEGLCRQAKADGFEYCVCDLCQFFML